MENNEIAMVEEATMEVAPVNTGMSIGKKIGIGIGIVTGVGLIAFGVKKAKDLIEKKTIEKLEKQGYRLVKLDDALEEDIEAID